MHVMLTDSPDQYFYAWLRKLAYASLILTLLLACLGCNEPPRHEESITTNDRALTDVKEPAPQPVRELGYAPFFIGEVLEECEGWKRMRPLENSYYALFDNTVLEGEEVESVILVKVTPSRKISQVSFSVELDEFDSFDDAEAAFTSICRQVKEKYNSMVFAPLIDDESIGMLGEDDSSQQIHCSLDSDRILITYFSSEEIELMSEEHRARQAEGEETLKRF